MATLRWIGNALAVAQINTITPASVGIGNVFVITINGKSISFTATATTVANVTAGLVALLSASTAPPEFREITWTDSTTCVTATASVAGVPFTQTSSASGGTAANVTATTTANSGPNNWDVAANWSTGAVPVSTDTVYIENSNISILYGLSQSDVTLTALNISMSFTGTIGLPKTNPLGYYEYRTDYLTISATDCLIGYGVGNGSGRIKLKTGSNICTMTVLNTGNTADTGIPSVLWNSNVNTCVGVFEAGNVGVSFFGDESSTHASIKNTNATIECGPGSTITAFTQNGAGSTLIRGIVTTWNNNAGQPQMTGSGTIGTLNLNAGTLIHQSSGTITAANIGVDGRPAVLDRSATSIGVIITDAVFFKGGQLLGKKTVTHTNAPTFNSNVDQVIAA